MAQTPEYFQGYFPLKETHLKCPRAIKTESTEFRAEVKLTVLYILIILKNIFHFNKYTLFNNSSQ